MSWLAAPCVHQLDNRGRVALDVIERRTVGGHLRRVAAGRHPHLGRAQLCVHDNPPLNVCRIRLRFASRSFAVQAGMFFS
ncbi:MAG TPA: hypothetical protein VIX73_25335 [Kofleriaceae bacterium]|jgi:hypothetical protein